MCSISQRVPGLQVEFQAQGDNLTFMVKSSIVTCCTGYSADMWASLLRSLEFSFRRICPLFGEPAPMSSVRGRRCLIHASVVTCWYPASSQDSPNGRRVQDRTQSYSAYPTRILENGWFCQLIDCHHVKGVTLRGVVTHSRSTRTSTA